MATVGEVISQALKSRTIDEPYAIMSSETDAIIAAVNASKGDQAADNLAEMRALDALIRSWGAPVENMPKLTSPASAQRIGACVRRLELSPPLKCR